MRGLGGLGVALVLLMAGDAWAWQARWCNGQVSRWRGLEAPLMEVEARWGAPGSSWGEALRRGMAAWNDGGALRRSFRWRYRAFDRSTRNGRNEVTVVAPETIDGAHGLTWVMRRACAAGPWPSTDGVIYEADVLIALNRQPGYVSPIANCDLHHNGAGSGAVPRAEPYRTTREATIIHEFGHALGLQHEDHAMALMMSSGGEGRYCGSPQFAPHPDDLEGLRALYGHNRAPLHDLAASAFRFDPAIENRIWMVDPQRTVEACPGEFFDVGWAVANRGSLVAGFTVEWYASQSPAFDRATDLLLGVSRGTLAPARYWDGRHTLRMSRHLPVGVPHYLGYRIVPDGFDSRPGNNLSYNATRVVRRPRGECR